MVSIRKSESISIGILLSLYVLSLLLVGINYYFQIVEINIYQNAFFYLNKYVSLFINIVFLIVNSILINRVFTQRDRNIHGIYAAFIYLLVNNKIWFFNSINNYLVSDFFILISIYLINPQEVKKRLDLLVFYIACFFGLGFLSGIHLVYSFIIPILIFNLFLSAHWKTRVIFILGFLVPVYFFTTISLLTDKNPFLYLRILWDNSSYHLNQFSVSDFTVLRMGQWLNISILINLGLILLAGLKEWNDVYFYSTRERRIAMFFFLLMFFSLINYTLIYLFYHQHSFSVLSLPYAYYLGNLINKVSLKVKYFILFLLFILTVFL